MINDAQVGDAPAMVSDARAGDTSETLTEPQMPPEAIVEPAEEAPPAESEPAVEAEPEPEPESSDEEAVVDDEPRSEAREDLDAEAQGRLAAEAGEGRGSNPYDGRTANGRAWYRGFDSVQAEQ